MVGDNVFKGLLNCPGQVIDLGGVSVMANDYMLTFASDEISDMKEGTIVKLLTGRITGTFKAREVKPQDDGVFSVATLKTHG